MKADKDFSMIHVVQHENVPWEKVKMLVTNICSYSHKVLEGFFPQLLLIYIVQ